MKQCGCCIIVGFSGRGFSPLFSGVPSSHLLLLSFNGFRGKGRSCVYRGFSSTFCGTLARLATHLRHCHGVMFRLPRRSGRPRASMRDFRACYRTRRFMNRIIGRRSVRRMRGNIICVIVHRASIIGIVGQDQRGNLGYKISFKLVTCGSAPTCRIVSRKVATLDVG